MDDADCGINPVTGDKMGRDYSGLCMHPGCYKVVDHGLSHACGGDHGGGNYDDGQHKTLPFLDDDDSSDP